MAILLLIFTLSMAWTVSVAMQLRCAHTTALMYSKLTCVVFADYVPSDASVVSSVRAGVDVNSTIVHTCEFASQTGDVQRNSRVFAKQVVMGNAGSAVLDRGDVPGLAGLSDLDIVWDSVHVSPRDTLLPHSPQRPNSHSRTPFPLFGDDAIASSDIIETDIKLLSTGATPAAAAAIVRSMQHINGLACYLLQTYRACRQRAHVPSALWHAVALALRETTVGVDLFDELIVGD